MIFTLREELPGDAERIQQIHTAAFPTPAEGRLVDLLRNAGRLSVSLVAVVEGQPVGHIAFSPVSVGQLPGGQLPEGLLPEGLGLAPLAVLPDFQKQGIGGGLIRSGLAACVRKQVPFVVVLGEPGYYGRFGFQPAARWNLSDEYGGGEAFQALELVSGGISAEGRVRYAPEFSMFATGD